MNNNLKQYLEDLKKKNVTLPDWIFDVPEKDLERLLHILSMLPFEQGIQLEHTKNLQQIFDIIGNLPTQKKALLKIIPVLFENQQSYESFLDNLQSFDPSFRKDDPDPDRSGRLNQDQNTDTPLESKKDPDLSGRLNNQPSINNTKDFMSKRSKDDLPREIHTDKATENIRKDARIGRLNKINTDLSKPLIEEQNTNVNTTHQDTNTSSTPDDTEGDTTPNNTKNQQAKKTSDKTQELLDSADQASSALGPEAKVITKTAKYAWKYKWLLIIIIISIIAIIIIAAVAYQACADINGFDVSNIPGGEIVAVTNCIINGPEEAIKDFLEKQ